MIWESLSPNMSPYTVHKVEFQNSLVGIELSRRGQGNFKDGEFNKKCTCVKWSIGEHIIFWVTILFDIFQTKKMPHTCSQAFQCTPEWNNWHWLKVQGVIIAIIFSFWTKTWFYGCQIRQSFPNNFYCAKKIPNMEFFVVHIFPYLKYLFQRQENTNPKNPYQNAYSFQKICLTVGKLGF